MRSISACSAKASAATLSAIARTPAGMSSGRVEPKRARWPSARMASIAGDVVHHVAVADRPAAAGIVAGHAAQRALRRGRDVDRVPEAVRLQPGVELVEHDARLHRDLGAVLVEAHDLAQVLGDIDDQRLAHRLAALRGAGAARQDGGLGVARHVDDEREIGLVARHDDADRLDLVDRGVGRVAAARGRVEQDVALDRAAQSLLELGSVELHPGRGTTFCHFSISVRMRLANVGRRLAAHLRRLVLPDAPAAWASPSP